MTRTRPGATLLLILACTAPARGADPDPDPATLTLRRIITDDEFRAEGFGPARWLADGSGYTTVEPAPSGHGREIVRYDPATGRRDVLVPAERLAPPAAKAPLAIDDYEWSSDGRRLLVFTNSRRVWRRNTRGDYWVVDLDGAPPQKLGGDAPESSLMFAKFAPDGRRVAFVRDHDLYVEEVGNPKITRLTSDGSPTRINGTFDWVYEEEFSLRDGYRWSPDGASIAYWQIDTEGMQDYTLVNTTDALYPKLTPIRYPKVGQTNPSCRVGVVPSAGGATRWIDLPGDPRDHYIPRMDWAGNPGELALQRLNRLQNTDEVLLADAATGRARAALVERDGAWVDVVDDVHWIDGGKSFTWTSERDGWRRLHVAPRDGRGDPRPVTPAGVDVIAIVRVDPDRREVDYLASPDNPAQQYLFRAPLDGPAPARRLTPADQPGTHDYQVSPDGRWAIHTHSTFDRPPAIDLVSLPDHRVARTLVDNAKLRARLDALRSGPTEFFRVDIGEGVGLDGWTIRPPGFDPSRKYPLLMHVYGEPAGQTVLDRWGGRNGLWHRMLAQRGFVVASVDNRGTPAPRGRAWRKCIYRQVGILASRDQAEAVRALERRWPFVDPARVGVWGWSGGGSMSLNAIFRHPDLYHTAVAVAFISDQRLYDTVYQERYMALPSDNPDGYRDGSPITFADRLRGDLLLVHGTGDDNCHYQSCERLVDRLIAANRPFAMLAYPNRTHSISEGPNTSRHLYESMTRFLEQSLRPGPAD